MVLSIKRCTGRGVVWPSATPPFLAFLSSNLSPLPSFASSSFPTIRLLFVVFVCCFFSSFPPFLSSLCLPHKRLDRRLTLSPPPPALVGVTTERIGAEQWGRVRLADRDTVRSVSQRRERAGAPADPRVTAWQGARQSHANVNKKNTLTT